MTTATSRRLSTRPVPELMRELEEVLLMGDVEAVVDWIIENASPEEAWRIAELLEENDRCWRMPN